MKEEAIILQLKRMFDSIRYMLLLERDTYLREDDERRHWEERARVLTGRANAALKDMLPMTSFAQSDIQELVFRICAMKLLA